MVAWTWFHILQSNLSGRIRGAHEDTFQKPGRRLPSGRVPEAQVRRLRWYLLTFNLALSMYLGLWIACVSIVGFLVEILYEDLGWRHHFVLRNVCNALALVDFETGAMLLLSPKSGLGRTPITALFLSAALILTTIHSQDFADVETDRESGRRTLILFAPKVSRIVIPLALITWSAILAVVWRLGPLCTIFFLGMGTLVGGRYYYLRQPHEDELSSLLYDVWLASAHMLPANTRLSLFHW